MWSGDSPFYGGVRGGWGVERETEGGERKREADRHADGHVDKQDGHSESGRCTDATVKEVDDVCCGSIVITRPLQQCLLLLHWSSRAVKPWGYAAVGPSGDVAQDVIETTQQHYMQQQQQPVSLEGCQMALRAEGS